MREILHQYKIRLTNLSQANRSLKLNRLSSLRDMDLLEASHVETYSAEQILERCIQGKKTPLLKSLSARVEKANSLDQRLNKIYREVSSIEAETGQYDLALGYPWVRGQFVDGKLVSCPVFLFPMRLRRNLREGNRWELHPSESARPQVNRTFFLAYEKFHRQRFAPEFWDDELPEKVDIQGFLNYAYEHFKEHHLEVNFNSELFTFQLQAFREALDEELEKGGLGKLKFHPFAVLGIFPQASSSLLLDYEDLESRPEDFPLGHIFAPKATEVKVPLIKEEDKFFVAPVDESQEEALVRAKAGQNLVVHGPPGTGKSQVILNLIADAMASGKRVLLCSQKKAALDVVFDRLDGLGLSRFCARIHDVRNDRQELYAHIRRQIEDIETFKQERMDLRLKQWERELRHDCRKIDEHIRTFDDLHTALTQNSPSGLSPHELYLRAQKANPRLDLKAEAREMDEAAVREFLDKLKLILKFREFFDEDDFWFERKSLKDWQEREKSACLDALEDLDRLWTDLQKDYKGSQLSPDNEWSPEDLLLALHELQQAAGYLEEASFAKAFESLRSKQSKLSSLRQFEEVLQTFLAWKKGLRFLKTADPKEAKEAINLLEIYRDKKSSLVRFFNQEWKNAKASLQVLLEKSITDEGLNRLEKESKKVLAFYVKLDQACQQDQVLQDLRKKHFKDLGSMHGTLCSIIEKWEFLKGLELLRDWLPKVRAGAIEAKALPNLNKRIEAAQNFAENWIEIKQKLHLYISESQIQKIRYLIQNIKSSPISEYRRQLEKNFEELRVLDRLKDEFNPSEKKVFGKLEPHLIKNESNSVDFGGWLLNEFYLQWIAQAEARHPVLSEVSSRIMEEKRADFRLKVKDRQNKVVSLIDSKIKSEILDNLSYNRLRNPVTYRDLLHQVSKKRRIWPARKLIGEFWEEGLARLVPCWMASPESASALFPMQADFFDLVIFDEASQCYVEKALPVLLRGKTVVISGDEQQLRPFDLYTVKADDAEEAFVEDEIAVEAESILELAKNRFFNCHLSWHYRSDQDALIRFSNELFYEGRLQMVGSPQAEPEYQKPLQFVKVEGHWSRNRNLEEADRAISLITELLQRNDPPSIGLVTMNHPQQEAIKDAIDRKFEALIQDGSEEELKKWDWALNGRSAEERLFVKNIENVQGDERDVIIFSLGYSPAKDGRVPARFGLLNQRGGANRLNVAISRARKQIWILSSFLPEQLEVEDSSGEGPKLFKKYLQYARAISEEKEVPEGILPDRPRSKTAISNTLASFLADQLNSQGLSSELGIGHTGYQLDLGIKNENGRFVLGVECEGPGYFSGKSAKSREVYRWQMLEKAGWEMLRIWARNYYLGAQEEVKKIQERVSP